MKSTSRRDCEYHGAKVSSLVSNSCPRVSSLAYYVCFSLQGVLRILIFGSLVFILYLICNFGNYGNSPVFLMFRQGMGTVFCRAVLLGQARVCKQLRSPGIDSEEWIPPAYVAWPARLGIDSWAH
jgi:hypothetical protein